MRRPSAKHSTSPAWYPPPVASSGTSRPAADCRSESRGNATPRAAYVACTRPEQSTPHSVRPPHAYRPPEHHPRPHSDTAKNRASTRAPTHGRRDHCRLLVAHRGIGEQPDVGGQARAGGDATQGGDCVAARGAARERAALHCDFEHTEPRVGDPLAGDVADVSFETVVHHALSSASPGTSRVPRARRTARSTASGTASAASASAWSGVAAGTWAVLSANTTSPSNGVA